MHSWGQKIRASLSLNGQDRDTVLIFGRFPQKTRAPAQSPQQVSLPTVCAASETGLPPFPVAGLDASHQPPPYRRPMTLDDQLAGIVVIVVALGCISYTIAHVVAAL